MTHEKFAFPLDVLKIPNMQRKGIIVRTGKVALQGNLIVFAESRSVRCEAVKGTYIQNNITNILFSSPYLSDPYAAAY
jgi:hypothetical protein